MNDAEEEKGHHKALIGGGSGMSLKRSRYGFGKYIWILPMTEIAHSAVLLEVYLMSLVRSNQTTQNALGKRRQRIPPFWRL